MDQGNLSDDHKHHKSHNKIYVMKDIDTVPSNVQSANREALLYVFEDNEAVIKMIMKGRSPTMRHVSRTHRVALDWLFDRINLDPKIQIKCIDTKNQLAHILTKGNFTRDVWEIRCIIMKTILQEKVKIHYSTTIWYTNFSYASSYEDSGSESSGGQGMGKIGENFGVELDESQK